MVPEDSFAGAVPLRTYGPPAGTPSAGAVLLFHGLRSSMATLDREARLFAESGTTAILVDAPHHGARHDDLVGAMPDALSLAGHYVLLRLVREARNEVGPQSASSCMEEKIASIPTRASDRAISRRALAMTLTVTPPI